MTAMLIRAVMYDCDVDKNSDVSSLVSQLCCCDRTSVIRFLSTTAAVS